MNWKWEAISGSKEGGAGGVENEMMEKDLEGYIRAELYVFVSE